jgi:hypothetical protein
MQIAAVSVRGESSTPFSIHMTHCRESCAAAQQKRLCRLISAQTKVSSLRTLQKIKENKMSITRALAKKIPSNVSTDVHVVIHIIRT